MRLAPVGGHEEEVRRRSQNRVGLRPGVAELLEVLDRVQAHLAIGDMQTDISFEPQDCPS